ncbi:protein of unassigned function [Methylobacterium oryzae CBMB20]|uniref:Protein of unassigned function n=1 Tax=Methylobacterium oryzae CBMB20 TaxID=693986 RepID=A0A089NRP6_9HYPH|nr:protein of unassigned function [Methylobacterium oryzae CBMB20]
MSAFPGRHAWASGRGVRLNTRLRPGAASITLRTSRPRVRRIL